MRFLPRLFNRKAAEPVMDDAASGSAVEMRRRVEQANVWRDQLNPLRSLTMTQAVAHLEQAQRGDFADITWLYSFIERRDPDLLAIIERRTGALLEMDWNVKSAEARYSKRGLAFDARLADEQVAMLNQEYDRFINLYAAIEHLAMATYRGFAHVQFLAESEVLRDLNCLDQWNVLRDGRAGAWYWNSTARMRTARTLPPADRLDLSAYIVRETQRPVDEIALIKFLRQNLSAKDWDSFLEIYGLPGWIITMPQSVPKGKEAEYEAAAESVAKGGSGALPFGSTALCADQPRGISPFESHLRYWTEKLVLAGTGGLLTMLSMPQGIGSGSSSEHGDAFATLAKSEARRISERFQRSVDAYLLNQHFPNRPVLAYFELAAEDHQDVGEILDHAVKIKTAGGQVDWDEVSEMTGYTLSAAPEPAAPPPFARGGLTNRAAGGPAAAVRSVADRVNNDLASAAAAALAEAERRDLAPLADRIKAALALQDPVAMTEALRQLRADLPDLAARILANPSAARVHEETTSAALVNGLVEAATVRSGPPGAALPNRRLP